MSGIVELRQVEKIYGQDGVEVKALRGVDLELSSGEFTAVAGPSGSGKSTLLNIIGGLDRPSSGSVKIDGREIGSLGHAALSRLRLRRIGFVFQSFNLLPVLTAMENAEYVLLLRGVPAAERHRRVQELLARVGLSGMENRFPRELSGGQQQRVAIVRAVVAEPALVLADEPTANVDSETAVGLLDVMERLSDERGVTFLFSTHDPRVMERARRLIRLEDGRIVSDVRRENAER